jgi:molecular chaperone HscC
VSGIHVGIDLGTTYSLVAVVQDGVPNVIPNAVGELLTPSAVNVDGDRVLVGRAALARASTHPETTALAFKRDMGTDRKYELGGRSFSPEELSALVLTELKRDAEAVLGASIDEAVVTVPAYFGEFQRRATRDACELAGLRVERIINEPTAAALAYGLHHRERELRAIVLDLGGGTFDVTALEIMEGVIEIQASAGDTRLGGEDFVDAIVAYCLEWLLKAHGTELSREPVARARLREACELAKRRLSESSETRIAVAGLPTLKGTLDLEIPVSRAVLESRFQPLLERMVAPIERALRDAGRRAGEAQEVLLVGGATRMPCVASLAAKLFGRLPLRTLPPDEAVALGAAVQAALKAGDSAVADVVATDVAPFSLGIASGQELNGAIVHGIFSPIIERGTVLPASRVERFATMANGQTRLKVEVFQGEHARCEKNQKIGEYELKGIPPARAGEEAVDVRFSYDMNGVLDVDATIVSTNKTATFTVERSSGRLSRRELTAARARLARLKFHPRDALPNVTALSRADALFAELVGHERARLGQALGAFRASLETQEPKLIAEQREALLALLLELGRGRFVPSE